MKDRKIVSSVVSNDTGEILDEFREGDKYTKLTAEQREYIEDHDLNFNKKEPFIKVYGNVVRTLKEHLTNAEFTFVFCLCEFVCYEDCVLRKGGRLNGKVLNIQDLSKALDMDESSVRKKVNALIKKGILGKFSTGTIRKKVDTNERSIIIVNPYVYSRGVDISKDVMKHFFIDTGWREILENKKTFSENL